jgi:hypothetical protein
MEMDDVPIINFAGIPTKALYYKFNIHNQVLTGITLTRAFRADRYARYHRRVSLKAVRRYPRQRKIACHLVK